LFRLICSAIPAGGPHANAAIMPGFQANRPAGNERAQTTRASVLSYGITLELSIRDEDIIQVNAGDYDVVY
jgi:hypothetical protein